MREKCRFLAHNITISKNGSKLPLETFSSVNVNLLYCLGRAGDEAEQEVDGLLQRLSQDVLPPPRTVQLSLLREVTSLY